MQLKLTWFFLTVLIASSLMLASDPLPAGSYLGDKNNWDPYKRKCWDCSYSKARNELSCTCVVDEWGETYRDKPFTKSGCARFGHVMKDWYGKKAGIDCE